jgi:iron complex transport system permease protein
VLNPSATETTGPRAPARPDSALRVSLILALLVAILFLLSLGIGPVKLNPGEVIAAFFAASDDPHRIIVVELRLPRAILGVAIGAILAAGGAALQGLLRNPLAEPSLFGAPQAAALAAVTTISLGINDALGWGLPVAAILGAFLSVFVLLAVAGREAGLLVLILSGLAVSSIAGAGTVLAMNLAPNPFAALEIAFWLLGSLQDRSMRHVALALPFIAVALVLIFTQRGAFRALTLGEDAAASLGVDVSRLRLVIILAVALGVGASVAVAGTIAFIGLVAPHLMRGLVGPDPARLVLPASLSGAALLLAADIAVRLIPASSDIKVGVLTSIIGVPFFLYLIVRERRGLAGGLA